MVPLYAALYCCSGGRDGRLYRMLGLGVAFFIGFSKSKVVIALCEQNIFRFSLVFFVDTAIRSLYFCFRILSNLYYLCEG